MTGDGGFERRVVKQLEEAVEDGKYTYKAHRKKQHRFSSQEIDVLVDSDKPKYYCGIECKSKQIDVEKASKENNNSEAMLYFSQAFNDNKDGVNQVERITEFLKYSGRKGVLAMAYRRGRGRKVKEYALPWIYVIKLYNSDKAGIPRQVVKNNGIEITDDYRKIFELGSQKLKQKQTVS